MGSLRPYNFHLERLELEQLERLEEFEQSEQLERFGQLGPREHLIELEELMMKIMH